MTCTSKAREFVAMTANSRGGTEAVTVIAYSEADAMARLARLGYARVLWVI